MVGLAVAWVTLRVVRRLRSTPADNVLAAIKTGSRLTWWRVASIFVGALFAVVTYLWLLIHALGSNADLATNINDIPDILIFATVATASIVAWRWVGAGLARRMLVAGNITEAFAMAAVIAIDRFQIILPGSNAAQWFWLVAVAGAIASVCIGIGFMMLTKKRTRP
jgi:hypothetical protein